MASMRLTILALTLLLPAAAAAQTGSGPNQATYTISKLADGAFTLTWSIPPGSFAIGNSTFIVGDEDAIVVDTGLSREAGEAILGGLRQVTDNPVSMVTTPTGTATTSSATRRSRRPFRWPGSSRIPLRARASSPARSTTARPTV